VIICTHNTLADLRAMCVAFTHAGVFNRWQLDGSLLVMRNGREELHMVAPDATFRTLALEEPALEEDDTETATVKLDRQVISDAIEEYERKWGA